MTATKKGTKKLVHMSMKAAKTPRLKDRLGAMELRK